MLGTSTATTPLAGSSSAGRAARDRARDRAGVGDRARGPGARAGICGQSLGQERREDRRGGRTDERKKVSEVGLALAQQQLARSSEVKQLLPLEVWAQSGPGQARQAQAASITLRECLLFKRSRMLANPGPSTTRLWRLIIFCMSCLHILF